MNKLQSDFLHRYGLTAETLGGASPDLRLRYANLDAAPDPVPVSTLTPAAAQWLGDRDPAALDDESKKLLDYLNTDPVFVPKSDASPTREPVFQPAKLAGLHPDLRLRVWEANAVMERARRGEVTLDARAMNQIKTVLEPFTA